MRKLLLVTTLHLLFTTLVSAQISGVVYRDYNGDGVLGTAVPSKEPGVGGIVVNAYNSLEALVATDVSDNDGTYSLSTSGAVRVEFVIPSGLNCVSSGMDFTGFHNDGNNIRFVTGSASNVNYGILFPDDYTPNANPFVYVPIYHSGNPLGVGTAASASGFLGYEFNSTGSPTNLKTTTASGIGSVWGTAYSKQANKIFTAAFIKRQVGLGPMGTGGIYMLEPTASAFNITQFYDMDANGYRTRAGSGAPAYGQSSSYTVDGSGFAITYNGSNDSESGFPIGMGVVGTNLERGLPDNMNADCYDPASFDQVGKVGLGDLDISDDGKYLFVMNLYSRKLYRLELNDAYNPTSVVSVTSYAIPSVAVTNGHLRPFAVQYHRGKVYCGAVASGENGGSNTVDGATDLYAYVFEMSDPLGSATFNSTPILSYPLNYQKGYAITTMNNPIYNKWFPWTNNSNSAIPDPFGETMYPTPMFTNIDFSDRGDMIMDFTDRSGHQFGYNNFKYLSTSTAYVGLDIGGDVLMAGRDCASGGWVLENNGTINSNGTTLTGNSTTNDEGPGNGEFFAQDRATDDYHHETSQGAVAIVPGTVDGIFTVMDPVGVFQGGTSRFSTENGLDANRTVLYGGSDGEFSKANGLGDIEVAGEEPPIEVGNLVWNDANGDGIQSAGEVGIGNVTLELFCDFDNNNIPDGAAIASVNTDTEGQWYFNESNVSDGDCNAAGAQLGLQPNKTYIVRIGSADWTGGAGTGDLALKGLTLLNSTSAGMVDKSDNDASLVSSVPQLQFTTGKWGENNHSYDFGFADCIADAGANISLNCAITSGTIGTAAVSGNTYSWSPTTGLNNASIAQPTASPTATTTYTLTVNGICTDEVTVTVDNAAPTADAGNNVTLTCSTSSATIGTAAISGNTYSWSPSTGLNNATIAQPTATPTATTTYTVTVTGANACTATDVVTVTVDKSAPTADAGNNVTLTCTTTSAMIGTSAISGNTYSWSPSTGLDNASIAQPTASPTATTTYTVTVTGANTCTATDVVTVTVDKAAPTADAGNNATLTCTTTSAMIGTTAISGNTYSWSPSTGLDNASIAQPTASPTANTTYTVTVTGSNGCTATDVVTVTLDKLAPSADAGNNVTLTCTTTSTMIGTVAIGGNTYSWSPSTGLDNASIAQPTATPTVNTTYTVTVTGSNGCTATDVVTVTLDKVVPTADAGSNVTLNCTTTSTLIGTVAISGNSYSWSPSTGLDNASIAQPTATPSVNTTYTVTVTGSNGCTATDVVTVSLDLVTPSVDAGSNVTLTCTTTSAMIGTSAISGNSYSWSPSAGLDNASIAQPTATPTSNTTYTVTVTGSNGCTATDVVTVSLDIVTPSVDAGNNVTLTCTTTSSMIGTSAIIGNSYSWSPSSGLDNASLAQPTATPTVNTIYTVTVTGANGCTATDVVEVALDKVVPLADAGSNVILNCTTTSSMIGTVAISGNSYSWSPSTGLDNASIAQPTATPSVNTTYTVTVTGSNGCTATDVVTVSLDLVTPTADAGNNITLTCSMTSATIGTVALSGNAYSWSPSVGLNDANLAEPITNVTANTIYTVTVTGANGCTATDVVSVDMDKNAPSVSISGNLEVCNGSTTTLTVNGGVSWLWAPSGETTSSIVAAAGNYTVTATAANGCTATATETVQTVESIIGNYVWNDLNGNGLQDESSSAGINGVVVELWKETSSGSNVYAWDRDTLTANDGVGNPGYYKFVVCEAANYKVKFPLASGLLNLTDQTSTPETDLNSDASAMDGFSPVFAINPNGAAYQVINQTIDAGYALPAQLGNYVWNDLDKDGVQDANEVGVAGITVMLYNATNQVVGSTITDGYGYYKFNPLEDGIYSVSFTLPANYVFSDANQGGDDELDSDVNPATGWTTTYTLMPGDSNMSVDAGIHFESANTATVGNFVWYDTNQDGIQDAGEEGISGVTVTLYDNSGATVATMITNSNGFYLFTDVAPGTYSVGFTPPAGLTFSPNNGGVNNPSNSDVIPSTGVTSTFTVNAGDHITYVDAGLYSLPVNLGGLGDKVWYDVNQNGVQDAGESGVPDVTVTLFQSDGTTQLNQTQTDAFGNYIFNNLPQGQYIVGFSNLPLGYTLSPTSGTDSTTNSDANQVDGKTAIIYLSQGQFNMTYDAGIYNTTPSNNNSIGNYVWVDIDKDGIQDVDEPGRSGITATLYNSSNVALETTSTDASGYYLFPNLPNGDYYVGFSNLPANFVFTQTGAGTSTTDSDPNLVTGMTGTVSLTGNTHDMSLDAGIYRGSLRIGIDASLGDIVWYDMNGNGVQDGGEAGVPGVIVTLYESDATTVISTTTTNALGNYIFTGLVEETYVVGFSNLPVGFTISPKNADAQGLNGELNSDVNVGTQQTDAILLGEGEDKLSVDVGIVPPPTSASLGNLVWFDLNNDGLQNSGEPGVQGVGVALLDNAGNAVQYTTTNGNGEYYFVGLSPDTYAVEFSNLPSGYAFTQANADATGINGALNSDADVTTGQTATVTLTAGDNNLNLDAGIISTTVAAVGDYVWYDEDRDGIQDATEVGVGGVLVTLYDNTGTPVTSTITTPDGAYIFTNVTPGDYTIGFDNIPDGMEFTQEVGTATDNTNSNANPITGITDAFTVTPGSYNPTIDAGITIPATAGLGNYVWLDVNENGLQEASEPSVAGVVATLYASNGTTVLATAVTDGNGAYSFINLDEGTYVVGFSNLPLGSVPTQNVGVLNDALNSDMNILTRKTTPVFLPSGTFNPNLDAGIYFGIPVPVHELKANYAVIKEGGLCDVYWYTTDEKNAVNFDIERSLDGVQFTKVGTKDAKGTTIGRSIYSTTDDITSISNEPIIYYRIRLNDFDGHSMLSNVISVKSDATGGSVVYPSPFTNELTILYPSTGNSELDILLTDAAGRTIRHENKVLENGLNMIRIDGLDALAAGQYYIKLRDFNSGETFIHKVSK